MASNQKCQHVIKTLLRAAQLSNTSAVLVRELELQTAKPCNFYCLEIIGAENALEEYKQILNKTTMERVMNFEESHTDRNMVYHANTVIMPDLIGRLKRHRTWATWWEMV